MKVVNQFVPPSNQHFQRGHSLSSDGSLIAIISSRSILINDISGVLLNEIKIDETDIVFTSKWNYSGDILAIVFENRKEVALWSKSSNTINSLQVELKDPSTLIWSPHDIFALGTKQGNLIICDCSTLHTQTILGKHSEEITCGCWIDDATLVLGSNDETISFSNSEGLTIQRFDISNKPTAISHVVFDKLIYIAAVCPQQVCFFDQRKQMKIISLMPKSGDIICHFWEPDCSSILVATNDGKLATLSNPMFSNTTRNEQSIFGLCVGKLQFCICCSQTQTFALIDENMNLHLVQHFEGALEEIISVNVSMDGIGCFHMSRNGSVLLTSTSQQLLCYSLQAAAVYSSCGVDIVTLRAHRTLMISDCQNGHACLQINYDPTMCELGPCHIAIAHGAKVYIHHRIEKEVEVTSSEMIHCADNVKAIRLNKRSLFVQTSKGLNMYDLETGNECTSFSNNISTDENESISSFIVTSDVLMYGNEDGKLYFVHLKTMRQLHDFNLKHHSSIISLCSNTTGTLVVFVDCNSHVYLYDAINQELLPTSSFPTSKKILMWDYSNPNVFHVFCEDEIHSFVVCRSSLRGVQVIKFGDISILDNGNVIILKDGKNSEMAKGNIPIVCNGGELICLSTKDGTLKQYQSVTSVIAAVDTNTLTQEELLASFCKFLVLNKFNCAASLCAKCNNTQLLWRALGNRALEMFNIPEAINAFQQIHEVALVAKLEEICFVEEKNILAGHLAMLFDDLHLAEQKFLDSSNPSLALEMRCDFGNWNDALSLAIKYFPSKITTVAVALAKELEVSGDLKSSIEVLEDALKKRHRHANENIDLLHHISKLSLRIGNSKKALEIAAKLKDQLLYLDLATIALQVNEDPRFAAELFELGKRIPDAVKLWLKVQNIERVSYLLNTYKVEMDENFYNEYGLVCSQTGRYKLALEAYKAAKNVPDAVNICLTVFNDPPHALQILKSIPCKSTSFKAYEISKTKGDHKTAIQFLLLGNYHDEALFLAQTSENIAFLATIVGEDPSHKISHYLGTYYETKDPMLAAKFFSNSANHANKALNIYIERNCIDDAIELVRVKNHRKDLVQKLVSFLTEASDDSTVNKSYFLHQLLLNMDHFDEALKTGVQLVTENMTNGNYVGAHDIASKTMIKLHKSRLETPLMTKLRAIFNTIHTYHLAKQFIQKGEHTPAASLLARVSDHISMFATCDHLNIYISTCIECHKAGINQLALKYSKMICSDKELKEQLKQSTFRRKIESIIRRGVSTAEGEEAIDDYSLPTNGAVLASTMCICSGKYMVADNHDWAFCTISGLPALFSECLNYYETFGSDPIFGRRIILSNVKKVPIEDVQNYMNAVHLL